ncbi:MAG: BrxA/BrxB family bacilliredoxin [Sumerlaeia bacterium]
MLYDPIMVQPMRDEVTEIGFTELTTPEAVDEALGNLQGTALVFVNSVCGCAAAGARPSLRLALEGAEKKPEHLYAVFAGQDREATNRARSYFTGYSPSSPCVALLKDGEVVHMIERHHIEGNMPEMIANSLKFAFQENC